MASFPSSAASSTICWLIEEVLGVYRSSPNLLWQKCTMYWVTCVGNSANNSWASKSGFSWTSLNGTNCTMSLMAFLPFDEYNPPSPSSLSMFENYALPTPTIMSDKGNSQLLTNKFTVSSISWISPSVKINNTWYTFDPCCMLILDMFIA